MSGSSADLLARIARILGVAPEAFSGSRPDLWPRTAATMGTALDLLADPHGPRIARAYLDVADPAARRAIADTVVAIAGSTNLRKAVGA